jgi:hypothetical protein
VSNHKSEKGKDSKPTSQAETAAPAEQRATRIRLNEIDRGDLRFSCRDPKYLAEEYLQDLIASIHKEGMQVPIEFVQLGGKIVLTKGHRRVASCVILARKGAPRFSDDVELDAIEVLETNLTELLVRSILDNAIRKSLDQVERIRAARNLFQAGVHEGRAAEALGVSVQSYKRDLLIAGDAWMFAHVVANHVNPTAATIILKAMQEAANDDPHRFQRTQGEIDSWITAKAAELERKDKILQSKRGKGKGLSEADKQVRRYLSNQLAEHWADLIRQGASLDEDTEWTFQADLDLEKEQLQIGSVRLDLAKDPVRKLAEVASKLSQLAKEIAPILKRRHAEGQRPRSTGKAVVRDVEYLKDLGLVDLADQWKKEQDALAEATPSGPADPGFDAERPRTEDDLASEVDAPDAGVQPDANPAPDEEAAR